MSLRPLLAATIDPHENPEVLTQLRYPLLGSPKLDGIRALVKDGVLYSRKIKPIPNNHCQRLFSWLEGVDGELIVGDPSAPNCYNTTQSGVMSREGFPGVTFHIFDYLEDPQAPYSERYSMLQEATEAGVIDGVTLVPQVMIHNPEELLAFETDVLNSGFEGIMLRDPQGEYHHRRRAKENRSTLNEQILMKLKRVADDEAILLDVKEGVHNLNDQSHNYCGLLKRSSHKANLVPSGKAGTLICQYKGEIIEVAPGFMSHQERVRLLTNKESYIGLMLTFRHFPIGAKDKPRHPRFKGWRATIDL